MDMPPLESKSTISAPPAPPEYRTPNKSIFFVFALVIILVAIGIGILVYNNTKQTITNTPQANKDTTDLQEIQDLTKQAKELMEQSKSQGTNGTGQAAPRVIQPNTSQSGQWSTYQNTAGKFSVPYPAELQVRETAQGFGVSSVEFRNAVNSAVPADYQVLVFPKLLGKTIGQDFDTSYAASNGSVSVIQSPSGTSNQRMTKLQNRTVGGQRAFDFRSVSEPAEQNVSAEVGTYVEIGNSVAVFSTTETKRGTLDTMLASFTYPL